MTNEEQIPVEVGDTAELSRAERKRLRRAEKAHRRDQEQRRDRVATWAWRGFGLALVLLVIGFVSWKVATAPPVSEAGLVSKTEVHWHARLDMRIKGEAVEIPANIGIPVGVPNAHPENMHTHAEDRVIHIEKLPPVYETDLKLGNFFAVWGKQFNSRCVMDACVQDGGSLKMLVNGKENTQFENYLLQDGDQVEIVLD